MTDQTNQSPDNGTERVLGEIQQAAELLTRLRRDAAEREVRTVTLPLDTLRMLEQQMWSAHIMAQYGIVAYGVAVREAPATPAAPGAETTGGRRDAERAPTITRDCAEGRHQACHHADCGCACHDVTVSDVTVSDVTVSGAGSTLPTLGADEWFAHLPPHEVEGGDA